MIRTPRSFLAAGAAIVGALALATQPQAADEATIVELTQTPCQFLEPENGVNHNYTSTSKADCEEINAQTGAERLAASEVMSLPAGTYIFRVTNQNVSYPLGFWIREADYDWKNPLHKVTKTSVSGGGLTTGATIDYEVELEAGVEYVFSCPLNPTPDYRIMVN